MFQRCGKTISISNLCIHILVHHLRSRGDKTNPTIGKVWVRLFEVVHKHCYAVSSTILKDISKAITECVNAPQEM